MTFFRQVLAICDYPELADGPGAAAFPADVLARAKSLMASLPGGTGAYSHSQGVAHLRGLVAEAMERRDGHPCDPNDIFMTDGASAGVHLVMKVLIRDEADALLTPIPQYPLYSAGLALYGGSLAPYYLDEAAGWGLSVANLQKALADARAKGKKVRALAVINPGNPTGQVLTEENLREVVQFCGAVGCASTAAAAIPMVDTCYARRLLQNWDTIQPYIHQVSGGQGLGDRRLRLLLTQCRVCDF